MTFTWYLLRVGKDFQASTWVQMLQKWLPPCTLMSSGKLRLIICSAINGKLVASWVFSLEITIHSAQDTKKKKVREGAILFCFFLLLAE